MKKIFPTYKISLIAWILSVVLITITIITRNDMLYVFTLVALLTSLLSFRRHQYVWLVRSKYGKDGIKKILDQTSEHYVMHKGSFSFPGNDVSLELYPQILFCVLYFKYSKTNSHKAEQIEKKILNKINSVKV